MCAWFSIGRAPKPLTEESERLQLPEDLWKKCEGCGSIIYTKELNRNLRVCPKCGHHDKIGPEQRIAQLCDRGSFEELDAALESVDPLKFKGKERYLDKLKKERKKTGAVDAVKTGKGRLNGRKVFLGVMNPFFIGGSMGSVVGEKLARVFEAASLERAPVIVVSASGGARMYEGIYSLMQMAKVTAALNRHHEMNLPYISVLTDPTTGGVAASFAMLGDINIAEPGALIGFAGSRVIEQTIKQKLPPGFQRAEFCIEHGMLDLVVPREQLKDTIGNLLELLMH